MKLGKPKLLWWLVFVALVLPLVIGFPSMDGISCSAKKRPKEKTVPQETDAGTIQEGIAFLNENRGREGVIELASGLQYEVLKSGPESNPYPNKTSSCVVHYKGSFLNGVEFDSSYRRGAPMTATPTSVLKGWSEALQIMRGGDKWKLFLPSELAFGDSGARGKIPPGAVLIFEFELLEVKPPAGIFADVLVQLRQQAMPFLLILAVVFMMYKIFAGGGGSGKEKIPIQKAMDSESNKRVFFDVTIDGEAQDRVEFLLFAGHYPKTANNFRALCTGETGKSSSGKELTFNNSKFHHIIPEFLLSFTCGNGTGGESAFGSKFPDEWDNGYIAHDRPFLLSMANAGPDTNGSRFFITLAPTPHLDGKHVVFGKVDKGAETVRKMEVVGSSNGDTKQAVVIADCGEVKFKPA